MKQFYIITNKDKDPGYKTTDDIRAYLNSRGADCMLACDGPVPEDTDCILVLGGDGTLLQAARKSENSEIPFLGINLGTLGYLTEFDIHNALSGLETLLSRGPSKIEERMMLQGTLYHEGKPVYEDIALNDIILGRQSSFKILRFRVYVNGQLINTYAADGMIIATPTGSTAYSLSVGGPIIEPTASMIMMTPVAPHGMMNRSIVLPDTSVIRMELVTLPGRSQPDALVGFDSDNQYAFCPGDFVEIRKSERKTRILKINKSGFLDTLRHKLSET